MRRSATSSAVICTETLCRVTTRWRQPGCAWGSAITFGSVVIAVPVPQLCRSASWPHDELRQVDSASYSADRIRCNSPQNEIVSTTTEAELICFSHYTHFFGN